MDSLFQGKERTGAESEITLLELLTRGKVFTLGRDALEVVSVILETKLNA